MPPANEKRHAPRLLDKAVEATKERVRRLVADPQYSSRKFRERAAGYGVEAIIYPKNQKRGEDVLRVGKGFRVHGPEGDARSYGSVRSSIERVSSRLEELVCLDRHRVRGLSARNEELPLKPKCEILHAFPRAKHTHGKLEPSPFHSFTDRGLLELRWLY